MMGAFLTYCIHVCRTHLTKLQKLQDKTNDKIVRIITYSTHKGHSDPSHNAMKL